MRAILTNAAIVFALTLPITSCIVAIGNDAWDGKDSYTHRKSSRTIQGSGAPLEEVWQVSEFTDIEVEGAITLHVTQGAVPSVVVHGDDNIAPLVEIDVRGHELKIDLPDRSFETREPLWVDVVTPSLERLDIEGAVTADLLDIQGERLDLIIDGVGQINARGQVDRLDIEISGTGNLDLRELAARRVDVLIEGTGNARVHAIESLQATIEGTGNVTYVGQPATMATISGLGSVTSER